MPMPANDHWNSVRGGLWRHLQLSCEWLHGADVSHGKWALLVSVSGTGQPVFLVASIAFLVSFLGLVLHPFRIRRLAEGAALIGCKIVDLTQTICPRPGYLARHGRPSSHQISRAIDVRFSMASPNQRPGIPWSHRTGRFEIKGATVPTVRTSFYDLPWKAWGLFVWAS